MNTIHVRMTAVLPSGSRLEASRTASMIASVRQPLLLDGHPPVDGSIIHRPGDRSVRPDALAALGVPDDRHPTMVLPIRTLPSRSRIMMLLPQRPF